jgi:hypothetical protein
MKEYIRIRDKKIWNRRSTKHIWCKFPASYKAGRGHALWNGVAFVLLVAPLRHKRTVRRWTWTQTAKTLYFHQLVLQPREWRKCSRPANTDSDWLRRLALTGLNVEKVTLAGAHALDATATHSTYARMDRNKYTCCLLPVPTIIIHPSVKVYLRFD